MDFQTEVRANEKTTEASAAGLRRRHPVGGAAHAVDCRSLFKNLFRAGQGTIPAALAGVEIYADHTPPPDALTFLS
jgi:hypothetical protein